MRGGRHTGFKAVSTGWCIQQDDTTISPSPLMGEDQSLSQCLTLGSESEKRCIASSRHCGLDPQSRGVGCVAAVILASRQYPQGRQGDAGETSPIQPSIPLSLDGRGPKPVPVPDTGAEGENDADASSRHCGLDPQSTARAHATLSNYWLRPWRKLVLALRQYPQGGVGRRQDNTTIYPPLP